MNDALTPPGIVHLQGGATRVGDEVLNIDNAVQLPDLVGDRPILVI
ncbi:MAG TPA: hypothetical protein VIU11_28045 [Nakamurella sp.]